MPYKPNAFVLDSWSVIAYLEDEPSAERMEDILTNAHEHKTPLLTTVVNAGEIWYILARKTSIAEADQSLVELRRMGIEFVEADWKLARAAAGFKARHKMSYADCFAAALAKERKAAVVTGDPEFKQIEREVKVHWI